MLYDLEHAFQGRPTDPEGFGAILDAARALAEGIQAAVPDGDDRGAAVEHVREAVMRARTALELRGLLAAGDVLMDDIRRLALSEHIICDLVVDPSLYALMRHAMASTGHLDVECRTPLLKRGLQATLSDPVSGPHRLWVSKQVGRGCLVAIPETPERHCNTPVEDLCMPYVAGLPQIRIREPGACP